MAISDSLTTYLGPMPVWAWVALGGGGLYLYEKHKGSSAGGTGFLSSIIGGGSGTGTNNVDAQTQSGTNAVQADSNASWADDAIAYLEGQGYTQSQAQSAIGTYTNGGALDPSMATLVDNAVQSVGPPPQLIFPTGGTASTTSAGAQGSTNPSSYVVQHNTAYSAAGAKAVANGPSDKNGHRSYFQYTVKKGDTLQSIAKKFGSGVQQLTTWNNLKSDKTNPKVGSTIWV